MRTVIWASLALDIQPLLVPAFTSISKRAFSFRIVCIRCQISVYRQLSDQHLGGLRLTPFVYPPPPVPPTLPSSPFFP